MSEPLDLAEEYVAPFAIISHEEGSRYTSLTLRKCTPPRSPDFQLIRSRGWTAAFDAYCRTLSFERIVKMNEKGYQELMLEFYTTFRSSDDDDEFTCRLMGKNVTVTRRTLCGIFGFRQGGHNTVPTYFDPSGFWKEISSDGDGDGDFKNFKTPSVLIKDPVLLLMHKYISNVVFGRRDTSKVRKKDLFYLWCLRHDVLVATPCFLIATFKSVAYKRANLCLGNIITAIAVYFGTFNPLHTDMKGLPPMRALGKTRMKSANKEKEEASSSSGQDEGEDTNSVALDHQTAGPSATPPAGDTWMLISREMEKMQAWMNDGFNELKAGLDELRLEKLESDKAAEIYKTKLQKLSTRIKKIEDGIAKMSSTKLVDVPNLVYDMRDLCTFEEGENLEFSDSKGINDSLRNESVPDAEDAAELLTSKSIGSKGLSKNGDRNSSKPSTKEDDTVKKIHCLPSGHYLPQPVTHDDARGKQLMTGEGRVYKTTCSSSAAARDIIDISESDDETDPKGAEERSKRVLSSDEMNPVQGSKRNRTESLENLFSFSTTKVKNEVRTVDEDNEFISEKGNRVLKSSHDRVGCSPSGGRVEGARDPQNSLNDGVSNDSEDGLLSDSEIDDLIASLREEKRVRKFMYGADMLRAFQQDEELCLNAVCALYRQKFSSSKSDGFIPIDSMSGCALAEYLIDGDKELRLTKSVSQVKTQRPDVITQCRKFATNYVENYLRFIAQEVLQGYDIDRLNFGVLISDS